MTSTSMSQVDEQQWLFTRAQVAKLLGCSKATVIRLQREGRLSSVRLTQKPTSQVYFRREEILALVKE